MLDFVSAKQTTFLRSYYCCCRSITNQYAVIICGFNGQQMSIWIFYLDHTVYRCNPIHTNTQIVDGVQACSIYTG